MRPSPQLARFLYTAVGSRWSWQSRQVWSDAEWRLALERPGTELWMSWYRGRPTGYVELAGGEGDGETTRICYLGLLPGFCGHGLGGQLLADATRRAWTVHLRTRTLPPVGRVELDTCELDSPAALANYLARGYRLVRQVEVNRPAQRASASDAARGPARTTRPGILKRACAESSHRL
jgi:GNAT superfamily N-acetyltransferase